jgi:hypothetical protein
MTKKMIVLPVPDFLSTRTEESGLYYPYMPQAAFLAEGINRMQKAGISLLNIAKSMPYLSKVKVIERDTGSFERLEADFSYEGYEFDTSGVDYPVQKTKEILIIKEGDKWICKTSVSYAEDEVQEGVSPRCMELYMEGVYSLLVAEREATRRWKAIELGEFVELIERDEPMYATESATAVDFYMINLAASGFIDCVFELSIAKDDKSEGGVLRQASIYRMTFNVVSNGVPLSPEQVEQAIVNSKHVQRLMPGV